MDKRVGVLEKIPKERTITLHGFKGDSNRVKEIQEKLKHSERSSHSQQSSCDSPPRFPHTSYKTNLSIDLHRVLERKDSRTMIIIKNIPKRFDLKTLEEALPTNNQAQPCFDFLFLPCVGNANLGYAFCNVLSPKLIVSIYADLNGNNGVSVKYSAIQGKSQILTYFGSDSKFGSQILLKNPKCKENNNLKIGNLHGAYSEFRFESTEKVLNLLGGT